MRVSLSETISQPDVLSSVEEHLTQASILLAGLGPRYERLSWMLQDILPLLENAEGDEWHGELEIPREAGLL